MQWAREFFIESALSAIADFSALWFIIGLAFFLAGLFCAGVFIITRLTGIAARGKIRGGIKKIRFKKKLRQEKEVIEKKETLWPVYEYRLPGQETKTGIGSEGGSILKKYKTGQDIDLIICPAQGYDDIYIAESRVSLYLGTGLCICGIFLMSIMIGMHGLNVVFWFSILGTLGAAAPKIAQKLKPHPTGTIPEFKKFNAQDIRPLEELL